jgi:hypothetical protein
MKFKFAYKDSTGAEHEYTATDAWLSVLEKHNSKWVESALAQTFDTGKWNLVLMSLFCRTKSRSI